LATGSILGMYIVTVENWSYPAAGRGAVHADLY
jgi:hypothetical protein